MHDDEFENALKERFINGDIFIRYKDCVYVHSINIDPPIKPDTYEVSICEFHLLHHLLSTFSKNL